MICCPSKPFFRYFICFYFWYFIYTILSQLDNCKRILRHILRLFLFYSCLTGVLIRWSYFKNCKAAVFRDNSIITPGHRLFIFCVRGGGLDYQLIITFLYINSINNPFTIIADHSFPDALPVIVDRVIKWFLLGK